MLCYCLYESVYVRQARSRKKNENHGRKNDWGINTTKATITTAIDARLSTIFSVETN